MHEALEAYKPNNRTFVKPFEVPAGAQNCFPFECADCVLGLLKWGKGSGIWGHIHSKMCSQGCMHVCAYTHTHRQSGATHKHVTASQGLPEPPWISWLFPGKPHPLPRRVSLKNWRFRAHSLASHPSRVTWANDRVSPSSEQAVVMSKN